MSLTVHYNALQDKTFAYLGQQGRNRFIAKGQWTEDEVRMALRIVKNFPIGSWNRNPETVQFAFALALARNFEAIRKTNSDLVATEIFIDTASGQQSVGRRVDDQPQQMTGVEILHLDPGHGIGDTYELVYDNSAQTLAWQEQGQTSTNTESVREGTFDILDDTSNLFVHVRVRPDELPPEDRTESFLIEDRLSVDYLERVANNYFSFPRKTGESDADYRQRIKGRIKEIKTTIWGMKDRFDRVLGYIPRMEETREWHEDFFVAGKAVPGSDIQSVGVETDGQTPVVIQEGDGGTHIDTYIDESTPDTNFGTAVDLSTGSGISDTPTRSMLEFDLTPLPANALIYSATLEIYAKTKHVSSGSRTLNIHRIKNDWTESGVGSATWNNSNSNFDPDIEGTITTGVAVGSYKVSTDLTAIVQAWVDYLADPLEGKPNHGLMVMDSVESDADKNWTWGSREDILARRPILRVNYTTFTPGSVTTDPTLISKARNSINAMFSGASSANYFVRARVKASSKQSVDFTLSGTPGGTFVVTVNGVNHVTTGQASITAAVADLVSKISNGPEKDNVTATDNDPIVTVTQDVPGQAFIFSSSVSGGAAIAENETQSNIAGINTALAETSPASRRIVMDVGYGVELASLEPEDVHLPSSGGATLIDLPSSETDYKSGALSFGSGVDKRADFDFQPNENIAGTYHVVISYKTSVNTGVALLAVDIRVAQAGAAWDAALSNVREFKLRPPYDPQDEQHLEIRQEFAVTDFTLATPSIIQMSVKRLGSDGRDDLSGDLQIVGVRLYRDE
jgi:hypothetical protein